METQNKLFEWRDGKVANQDAATEEALHETRESKVVGEPTLLIYCLPSCSPLPPLSHRSEYFYACFPRDPATPFPWFSPRLRSIFLVSFTRCFSACILLIFEPGSHEPHSPFHHPCALRYSSPSFAAFLCPRRGRADSERCIVGGRPSNLACFQKV